MIALSLILDTHVGAYDTDIYRVLTLKHEYFHSLELWLFMLYQYGMQCY